MNMVSITEARRRLSELVSAAERGESIVITRRGRKVARLVPVAKKSRGGLPDLAAFRKSIQVAGRPLSRVVADGRWQSRY